MVVAAARFGRLAYIISCLRNKSKNKKRKRKWFHPLASLWKRGYNKGMNAPTQFEFEFELDMNVKGEDFFSKDLKDPCEWCGRHEAAHTVVKRGQDIGLCISCAEDEYMDWVEQMRD